MLVIAKMIYQLEFYAFFITHPLHKIYIEKQEKNKESARYQERQQQKGEDNIRVYP